VTISRKVGRELLATMSVLSNFVSGKEKTLLYQTSLQPYTVHNSKMGQKFNVRGKSREPHIIAPSHMQHLDAK
jgi:hypothetical protein